MVKDEEFIMNICCVVYLEELWPVWRQSIFQMPLNVLYSIEEIKTVSQIIPTLLTKRGY